MLPILFTRPAQNPGSAYPAAWALRTILLALITIPGSHGCRISPPSRAPDEASAVLDQAYVSFAIEGRDFIDYSGTDGAPNEFSANMLSTFSQKTGVPLYLRVGGTTQDHFHYDPAQPSPIRFSHPTQPTYLNLFAPITVGRTWLHGFHHFRDVVWDVQLPLARKDLGNAARFAAACVAAIGSVGGKLHALEMGNEPDLYASSGFLNATDRPAAYSPADYAAEVEELAGAVAEEVGLGEGRRRRRAFQALGFSNFVEGPWDEETVFAAGLDPGIVKTVSEHYYQSEDGQDLGSTLMNISAIRNFTNYRFRDRIAYMKSAHPEIPFLIAEVGSALGNGTGIRDFDLTASLGTALWTVDWLLYCATIGVTRVNMQLGTRFPFSPWFPVTTTINNESLPAQTLGSFYGNVFVADFIGADGELRILELPTSEDNISAYAGFNSGTLSKVAVVNLELWRASYGTERPNTTVTLDNLDATRAVRVEKLTGPDGGAMAEDMTWAGTQWTAESKGWPVVVADDAYVVEVEAGTVQVAIQASEALLISLIPVDC